ncbi:HAD family hydrolase [Neobacillus sp. LXY-4]|uniref:HAD family hydrolase n=1 Tax=Neobacillus sp. LXY-4 TaxID=3379826 RepID=UPI003EDF6525
MDKAFIFDMDGVIIDSEPMHDMVDMEVAAGFNIRLDRDRLQKYVGMRARDVWNSVIKEDQLSLTADQLLLIADEKKVKFIEVSDLAPIDGIRELLKRLKQLNYKIALASSSPIELIDAVLHKFEIESFFDYKVSGDEVQNGKPAPDIYLETARRMNVNPDDCIVLEDSRNGIDAGNAAGMKTIGFANPGSGNQDLSKANHVVDSIEGVLEFI